VRKSLLYLTAAVILGITITLVPLVTLALVQRDVNVRSQLFSEFGSLERGSFQSSSSQSYVSDFTVLTVSFVIAMVLYLFVRRRIPRDLARIRFPPY
jgi:hypothetical protein